MLPPYRSAADKSAYNYVFNNPLLFTDPTGMEPDSMRLPIYEGMGQDSDGLLQMILSGGDTPGVQQKLAVTVRTVIGRA